MVNSPVRTAYQTTALSIEAAGDIPQRLGFAASMHVSLEALGLLSDHWHLERPLMIEQDRHD
jgi:hypothetical protein